MKMWKVVLIPTGEPETEHTEDNGSNDSGDEMDMEWEDN